MPDPFIAVYILAVFALLLWLAAIPMAARRASATSWWIHAVLALLGAVAQTVVVREIYSTFAPVVPWWKISALYVAQVTTPTILTGWGARAVVRQWPQRRWLAPSLVVLPILLLLLAAVATGRAGPGVFPDLINAVQ